MISTLYGTFGAVTGIAQGLIRGTFKPIRVPARSGPRASSLKHFVTELVADCVDRDTALASTAPPVSLLPLLVVGHSRAGKTTFVNTYLHAQCLEPPEPTLGADLSVRQLVVRQQLVSLQIWDTAGEEQADLFDSGFWANAAGALIVCNLCQADYVSALNFWRDRLHQDAPNLPIVVVGVKHECGIGVRNTDTSQEGELHVTRWCKDNNSYLFLVADYTDQSSAEMAVTAIVDKAMLYAEQKAKPMVKAFTAEHYPALFASQTDFAQLLQYNIGV